jgi:phosphate transport system substrate-binding protein
MVCQSKQVRKFQPIWSLLLAVGTVVATSGCISKADSRSNVGGESKSNSPAKSEIINVDGSSTVYLISQAWAVEFEKLAKHKVGVSRSGTGGGYKKFVLRQCDLWDASRRIAPKEEAELKEKGIEWLELEVAIDGLSVAVHPDNDWCTGLTVVDLKRIWEPESKIAKWSDLNPKWPEQPIKLFGADTDSGTFEYFTEEIVGKKGAIRTDYTPSADDNILIQGVAGNEFALGYIPFGYCVENKDKVKVIGVSPTKDSAESPAPFVTPTAETILSGEYAPLARPLFVYANKEAMKRPEVVEFLKYIVSEAAQPIVEKRGFVRMKEEKRKEMEARLEAALNTAT